ncbi:MAG: STAS domain-containing protein [Chromatiales bacterium]|jgi:phospholipid transport system transporter-binding protein
MKAEKLMPQIEQLEKGRYRITGVLDFNTVPALLTQVQNLTRHEPEMSIDFSAMQRSNSAGLALLLELVAEARKKQRKLVFTGLPASLLDLAKMSNVEQLLPVA